MKTATEPNRFYYTLAISLAINLFFLPILAWQWFWSSRAERMSVEELHPALVKTVTLRTPMPKLKPKVIPPLPKPRAEARPSALKPKAQSAPAPPRPHVMAIEGNSAASSSASSIAQGKGQVGVPTLPTAPVEPPPLPKGETRGALSIASPVPEIPESLRSQVLKTFVRARFDIAADGTAQVTLLTSSGSTELDQLTLDSLHRWRWNPALQNGVPVPSIQRLRIEFEVQ